MFYINIKIFSKNSENIGDKHIQVVNIRAKFGNEMSFVVLCAERTKSVTKIISKNTFLKVLILFFFAQSTKNFISFRKFAQVLKTCICLSPIISELYVLFF